MEGVARSMEPVSGRRVSPLRANLSAFFGGRSAPPIVQGEPYHIVYGSPASPLGLLTTTAIEGTVVGVVQEVQQVAQAEQRLERRVILDLLRMIGIVNPSDEFIRDFGAGMRMGFERFRRGPYQGG